MVGMILFQVVPLDKEFGIIEWVNETVGLKDLIMNSQELQIKHNKLCADWNEWIQTYHPRKQGVNLSEAYNVHARKCSRSEAEKRFDDAQKMFPSKLLRYISFVVRVKHDM